MIWIIHLNYYILHLIHILGYSINQMHFPSTMMYWSLVLLLWLLHLWMMMLIINLVMVFVLGMMMLMVVLFKYAGRTNLIVYIKSGSFRWWKFIFGVFNYVVLSYCHMKCFLIIFQINCIIYILNLQLNINDKIWLNFNKFLITYFNFEVTILLVIVFFFNWFLLSILRAVMF